MLFLIDLKTQLLPDAITLPTLWFSLSLSLSCMFASPYQAIFDAILDYGFLWITAPFYQLIRKKEGMACGNFKIVSMLGACFGPFIAVAGWISLLSSPVLTHKLISYL